MVDHGACRLGGVALAPERRAEPVAEIRDRAVQLGEAAGADRLVVDGDQERELLVRAVDRRNEGFGVRQPVRMRNARRVSAIRRSLASRAIALASSGRGARKTTRSVSRTGVLASRKVPIATSSSKVMARAPLVKKT
jgi:hypothetical protein